MSDFPLPIVSRDDKANHVDVGVRFGDLTGDGSVSMLVRNDTTEAAYRFDGSAWVSTPTVVGRLESRPWR